MSYRCPGLSRRNLGSKLVSCPGCGAAVEVFSDESSVRCSTCRTRVVNDALVDCRNWCRGCETAPIAEQDRGAIPE